MRDRFAGRGKLAVTDVRRHVLCVSVRTLLEHCSYDVLTDFTKGLGDTSKRHPVSNVAHQIVDVHGTPRCLGMPSRVDVLPRGAA